MNAFLDKYLDAGAITIKRRFLKRLRNNVDTLGGPKRADRCGGPCTVLKTNILGLDNVSRFAAPLAKRRLKV